MPPLPSRPPSFPACLGPAKWEGETQDGGSRELRLQPPAVRLPDLVSGGAAGAGTAWRGLTGARREAGFFSYFISFLRRNERLQKEPGMIEGKLSAVRGRAACGGTGAQAARKPEVWGLEGVHFRQPLAGQPLAEVLKALAPNLLQLLIECLVLSGSIPPAPGVERPGRARAGFPSPAQPGAASLRGCCILRAVLTLLPRTGGSSRAGMARNYSPCSL